MECAPARHELLRQLYESLAETFGRADAMALNEHSGCRETMSLSYKSFAAPWQAYSPLLQQREDTMGTQYALRIGLDWADQKHDLMVLAAGADAPVHCEIDSAPESIDHWLAERRIEHPAGRFAVCLEQTRGAVCYALLKYDFIDLYPANPSTLARYRHAFSPSRSKNDRCDAELLLDLLVKHPDHLRRLEPDSAAMRKLTLLCEARRKEVDGRTRLANRLQSLLRDYYPQALGLCGQKLHSPLALDFLGHWTTFQALRRARKTTITHFYKSHHASERTAARCLETIAASCPVTDDAAIMETSILRVRILLEQIRVANQAVKTLEDEIEKTHPEADASALFASFPGAGKALAPRLCGGFGSDRTRFASTESFQAASGIAPVTEASGKAHWVHWRWSCSKFLRQTLVEYAHESRKRSAWAKTFYDSQRAKGNGHHAALRALAFKWARIMYRCWQNRTPYDEEQYMQSLKKHGSWLAQATEAA